jgi:hypothetical protein
MKRMELGFSQRGRSGTGDGHSIHASQGKRARELENPPAGLQAFAFDGDDDEILRRDAGLVRVAEFGKLGNEGGKVFLREILRTHHRALERRDGDVEERVLARPRHRGTVPVGGDAIGSKLVFALGI